MGGSVTVQPPVFSNAMNGVLIVNYHTAADQTKLIIYRTTNGGATWTLGPALNSNRAIAIITSSVTATGEVFATTGPEPPDSAGSIALYQLPTGASSWTQITSGGLFTGLTQLDFLDATHGWAVTDAGLVGTTDGGVTWNVLHPPAANCTGSYLWGYYDQIPDPGYKSTNVYANIPMPPVSRIRPDDASGGVRGYDVCSPGTVASITVFMSTHLTGLGWTSAGNGLWKKNGYSLQMNLRSPTDWNIWWRDPDIHF